MAILKGGKNHKWTVDEKINLLKQYFDSGLGYMKFAKEHHLSTSMFWKWLRKYNENGIKALENMKKPGNPYAALHTSKTLSEVEQLKLIIMKKDIEIERLKKGYFVKGVGVNKEFVSIKDLNIK